MLVKDNWGITTFPSQITFERDWGRTSTLKIITPFAWADESVWSVSSISQTAVLVDFFFPSDQLVINWQPSWFVHMDHKVISSKDQKSIENQHQEELIIKEIVQDLEMSFNFF